METFKVYGKLKRKELSFGSNDVRGVNKREERLLRNALGSIEKERKRSLLNIQSKVEDLHVSLKETTNVWQGDKHSVDGSEIPVLQRHNFIVNNNRSEMVDEFEINNSKKGSHLETSIQKGMLTKYFNHTSKAAIFLYLASRL
jgi:hypothetical protein